MDSKIKEYGAPALEAMVGEDGLMIAAATCFYEPQCREQWPKLHGSERCAFISIPAWQPIRRTETEVCSGSRWTPARTTTSDDYTRVFDVLRGAWKCSRRTKGEKRGLADTHRRAMAAPAAVNSRRVCFAGRRPRRERVATPEAFMAPGRARSETTNYPRQICQLWPTTWSR